VTLRSPAVTEFSVGAEGAVAQLGTRDNGLVKTTALKFVRQGR
jgi:hypothetical protein